MKKLRTLYLNILHKIYQKTKDFIEDKLVWVDCCSNVGKFKEGDILSYNLFARICLSDIVKKDPKFRKVKEVDCEGRYVCFECGDAADSFWLRKKRLWERFQ